jgi:hypothetical protein
MRKFVFGGSYASAVPLLLDLYPNIKRAYSFYKLKSTYTGRCCRIRRSSDNAEQDIGFVGDYVDTAAILSFVGSGNGFVTRIENQANPITGEIAYNTTAVNQPRIAVGGALETENGRLCLNFYPDGTALPPFSIDNNLNVRTAFAVSKLESLNTVNYIAWSGVAQAGGFGFGGTLTGINGVFSFDNTNLRSITGESLDRKMGVWNLQSSDMYMAENGDALVNAGTQTLFNNRNYGGRPQSNAYSRSRVELMLISDVDMSADIDNIRTILNTIYDVY